MLYSQLDALAVYNIQNKIDILYAQDPEGAELDYTRKRRIQHIKDALLDYAFPGLKNDLRGDGLYLFLNNFVGGTLVRYLPGGIGQCILLPRPCIGSEGYATNLEEVVTASLSQCESVRLGGELIDLIKQDSDMLKKEKEFINKMIKEEKFIQTGKYDDSFSVQFGGSRENADVAMNQLTWIIRNTYVIANAVKNMDGSVTINYSLDPNEKLDLRPGNREFLYNLLTAVTGYFYHDVFKGNDQMLIKATWSTTIRL